MSIRRMSGFTLIELVVAIIVISVGLAGVLGAFQAVVRNSADPLVEKQMLALAEQMMEEVMLKPYATGAGSITGCNRSAADDIFDYNGYSSVTCTIDGTPSGPPLDGYTTAVSVVPAALGAIPAGATGATAAQISVTVSHGGQNVTLRGWRANYAANLP
ncbi:MAG TPA: type II secretion system protein [Rhodocyclaceae bacterium]